MEDTITYSISIPPETGGVTSLDITHQPDARWAADLNPTGAGDDDELLITVPDGTRYERIPISNGSDEVLLYLPDVTVVKDCRKAIDGDEAAVQSLVRRFSSPVRIPLIGGVGLDADRTAILVAELTNNHIHAESYLHTYRYPLIRAALVSPTGFSLDSKDALETFVDRLDAAPAVGPVNIIDAIVDVLATVHSSVDETTHLLSQLGYDVQSLAAEESGRLLCAFLARKVIVDDLSAAVGRIKAHQRDVDDNYDRRKADAESAPYEKRGQAWRQVLYAAAQEPLDEFAYVLANALYWTGEVSRSDARTQELLFEAAETVAANQNIQKIATRARFNRHIGAGHRLRSQHCFEMAHQRFKTAQEIATASSFLPEWKPVYNAGIVKAHALSSDGNTARAVEELADTIEDLAGYDLNPNQRAYCIRHLEAQKLESKAEQRSEYEDSERAEFLETAQDFYTTLGFERSVTRVQQKRASIQPTESPTSDTEGTAATESKGSTDTSSASNSTDTYSEEPVSTSYPSSTTSQKRSTASTTRPFPEPAYVERLDPEHQVEDSGTQTVNNELDSIEYSEAPEEETPDGDADSLDDPYLF